LIIECHPCPEKAMSDGAQSLSLDQFAQMMRDLEPYIKLWKESRVGETVAVA
jgi:3-deoxy-7-phosphoheptulonate synthase